MSFERRMVEELLRRAREELGGMEGLSFCREVFPDELGDPELEQRVLDQGLRLFECEGVEGYVIVFDGYAYQSGIGVPFLYAVRRGQLKSVLSRPIGWRERRWRVFQSR